MKNKFTKPIIFLVILAVIVIIITLVSNRSNSSPMIPAGSMGTTTQTVSDANNKTYTLADVAEHSTENDCWTTVNGGVYNLTSFVHSHPGGVARIIQICGIDGTSKFMNQHSGQSRPESELASLKIGTLTN